VALARLWPVDRHRFCGAAPCGPLTPVLRPRLTNQQIQLKIFR
jgi:hypothetical protein